MRMLLLTIIAVFTTVLSFAQMDIGVGGDVGFPLLFNKNVKGHNHASGVPGARLALNYAPKDGFFSGSLIVGIAPMILPVIKFNTGQDVLYMNFTDMHIAFMGRAKKQLDNEAELFYGIGAGVNFLKGNRVQFSKRSENDILQVIEDSTLYNSSAMPAIYINFEYTRPINPGSPIRYGIGAQLQYIYFFTSPNNYRVDIVDEKFQYYSLKPELAGHMFNPMLYVNLYYRLGK